MLLVALMALTQIDSAPLPQPKPVIATVDISRVNTNIENASNKDGVFQSTYTSTVFNLFLVQRNIQSPLKTMTGFYYVNVGVGFETLPQTGGTIAEPPITSFDSSGIKTASRTTGTVTFGWSFDTQRVNQSIKAAGPFVDIRLFDYIKGDNVGKRDKSGSYRLGYHYAVPLDSNNQNIIQLEISGGYDRYYSQSWRILGKARYNLYPISDGSCGFLEFSYNRSIHSTGPVELRYSVGVKLELRKLVSGLVGR